MSNELDAYRQAMADALDELGVTPPPVTSAELLRTHPDEVAALAAVTERKQRWGEIWAEAFRTAESYTSIPPASDDAGSEQ